MAGAHRGKRLATYTVDITRVVHWSATVEVSARSVEEAEGLAVDMADNPMDDNKTQWDSDDGETKVKAKLVRAKRA